uniref:GB1/RHD3-type G domain-containing protein n=1 Tax=Cairina moschata TaxID=8855 RepID=A0A8C3BRS8_CAIMO
MAAPPRGPLLLAMPGGARGGPRLFQRALTALRGAPAPVHVVAAFGPRGSGKSFLLDQLAGPGSAFPSSRGLWLRCCPHPTQPGHVLVLLDAAGFPAPGDEEEDEEDPWFLQLLVLQLLLASVFVYSSGTAAEPQEELERLTYVRALPRRLRLLEAKEDEEEEEDEDEEEEEEEGSLLRTVLPPFVWSLHGAAAAPEDEAVLEAEGHELRAALGPPPGPEAPVARRVLALFPEHKLFRLEAGGTGGLPQLCAHLLGCAPKTGLSGEPVGGAYLAALAERAAEALCGAEPLRVARLCREAEEAAWQVLGGGIWGGHGGVRSSPQPSTAPCPRQDEAKDVAKLWCGDEVARPDAADAWWGGGDGKGDGSGDAGTWQLGDAWQSDAAPQWDIDAWLGDSMTDEDVAVWLGDTMTEEDVANAWCGGDGDAKHDVNARHGYTIKEEDEVEIWCGGAATQRDVNLSNGATQRDANAGHGDAVTEEDATNAWCGGDGDTQRDVTARRGDTPEAVPQPKVGAMGAPQCLVQNGPDGVLSLNTKVLEVLRGIGQPVVVVAIAGRYRTGKSFLMNRLAQQRSGFPLGHTVQAHTKGIWMWCLPHPRRANTTLVLLDTEGLGDPNKGDSRNDAWIFTLALLLSSTLVYNSSGTIDQQALENLELVSELTDFIRTRAGTGERAGEAEDSDFVRFFPDFVWAVRDFTLELRADERPISEDEYLERALALKPGHGRQVMVYNTTRQCIRNYFPTRKCFVFPPPVGAEQQGRPEELPEAALQPGFLLQVERFCQHVLAASRPKELQDGAELNGRTFGTVVRSYLETISSGRVPCLEGTMAAVAASENAAAVAEALVEYRKGVQDVVLPAEQHELSEVHNRWLQQALAVFHNRAFRDRDQQQQLKLMEELQAEYGALLQQNEEASRTRCRELLAELAQPLEANLAQGTYAQPGGYRAYQADRKRLVDAYREAPNKGTKAEEMLDKFLEGRKAEAEAVLKADNALTEVEKQLADQKQQAELLGQAQKAAEERNKQLEVLLADQERSYQESLRMMEAKLQAEGLKAQEEIKRAMEAKMQEQERLLKQGFSERAKLLEDEVASLRKSLQTQDMVGHICTTLQAALKTACEVVIMLNKSKALK